MRKIIMILILFAFSNASYSTHLMGGEITWKCIKSGPNTGFYVFEVKVYRDCQGIPIDTNINLDVHNVPGLTSISLTWVSGIDISPPCDTINGPNLQFSCNGLNTGQTGNGNGSVEEHIYRSDTIRILGAPDANGWHFTWSSCCRNAAIINGLANEGFTLRAVMYPFTDSIGTVFPNGNNCFDSSPRFYEIPRTILEVGNGYDSLAFSNGFTYSHNAFDDEMDSISYTWGRPLDDQGYNFLNPNSTSLSFTSPYSYTNPINGIVMNSLSGRTWYPANAQGNYVTCTKVSAYKCGQLVAEVFREIQIVLIPPTCNLGDTTNGNVGADTLCNVRPLVQPPFFYPTSPSPYQWDTLVHCGDTVSFDFVANDYDIYPNGTQQDLLFEVSGGQFYNYSAGTPCQNPPCATFEEVGTGVVPPFLTSGGTGTGYFEWITSCNHVINTCGNNQRPGVYTFVIKVSDDFCPAPAIENTSQVITIIVYPACSNLKIPLTTINATCAFNDGTAQVAPFGGTPPYTSYWTNMNGLVVNPNTLSPGDYIVRVTDSTGCSAIDTFTIYGPATNIFINSHQTNVSCNGGSDGTIDLIVVPDSSLVFSWNNGSTTQNIDSLSLGVYVVNITDTFSCVTTQSFVITEPNQLLVDSALVSNVTCNGGNDGAVDISISGGTQPYSYNWSNSDTIEDISNLSIGNYTVTITDSNLCTSLLYSYNITEPNSIVNTMISTPVSCFGAVDGSVSSFQSGGIPPYTYLWSNGNTNQSISNLGGGNYVLNIFDASNCLYVDSISISEPNILQSIVTDSSGVLTGISIGGSLPYSYEFWGPNGFVASNTNNFGNSFSISPNVAGIYTFIVIDSNNCIDSVSINYSTNFSPTVNVTLSNTLCDSLTNLTIEVSQDSGEVDMSTALFQSNAGSFDIVSMNVGDTIGTAVMIANGGFINLNTFLIVSAIVSANQVLISSCSPVNGCIGSFAISNIIGGGIAIISQTVPDGNNYTNGNSSTATFNNVFVNPCTPLTFDWTINSELGDVLIDSVTFILTGLCYFDETDIMLYPNPTSGKIVLDFKRISEKVNIRITDISGKSVLTQYEFRKIDKKEISISFLRSGSYIIMIDIDGIKYSKIILKQ
ncbi:MAG: T9SS type A sorting domain-containing protein [Bacteroidota bacterium]|nr:T9SS type A sorting domain-containing protein [Bacteroidota bacterium]